MTEKEMLEIPPDDTVSNGDDMDVGLAPAGPAVIPMPMPRGFTLVFQPLKIESGLGYRALAKGECEECGVSKDAYTLSAEVTQDGIALVHQCPDCGHQHILQVCQTITTTGRKPKA